jgi:hypothetical protein
VFAVHQKKKACKAPLSLCTYPNCLVFFVLCIVGLVDVKNKHLGHLLHLHLSHLADALIQSDLQIGAFTL